MFEARKEKLKDLKKIVRLTKKLISLIKERNALERQFLTELEDYYRLKQDIQIYETNSPKSQFGKEANIEYIKLLRKQLKDFESQNPLTSEQKKAKRKVDVLQKQIDEYFRYISSKSHDFIYLDLTWNEYCELCECDILPIFVMLLIFRKTDNYLFDNDSKVSFRRQMFLHENQLRTALTKKFNADNNMNLQPWFWEKEEDLLHYPIFSNIDFESFVKFL